ncbi:CDP-diacylglycerol--glycerol-3-phosphate 3-phosphatidyltransferase, mitochondrial [Nosema granulosis]|uniref:CDP-diacylglycerol--glycerol-3-phosphate 3-phosphatidyltransferase n=1 Tax=Nosema granulosis TaxID=83296 RepID=A0A9P6L062_9MICR|nr:CDP-diacylglycerol--glycerol-3-phosphate 3-phosphatidyltransferase, mitochondrial [Nosema granulosis]
MEFFLQSLDNHRIFNFNNVTASNTPGEFFNLLKQGLTCSKVAYISTLYFGETEITNELISLIEIRNKTGKRTVVFLDAARGMTKHIKRMIFKHNLYENFYFKQMNFTFLPGRLSEFLSVFHSKLILFDDIVVFTGANITDDYFTTRIDRYYSINDPSLANNLIEEFFFPLMKQSKRDGYNIIPKNTQKIVLNDYKKIDNQSPKVIQYDETSEFNILEALAKQGFKEFYISTAYLNFPDKYINLLKNLTVKIFVSAPETNKFNNYGLFCNTVTEIYKYSSLKTALRLPKAQIYEFKKEGYTIHTKGLWAFSDSLSVTIVGSSNFNRRSFERDSELNFLLVSNKKEHIDIFRKEVSFMSDNSNLATLKDLSCRHYSLFIMIIYFVINKFL